MQGRAGHDAPQGQGGTDWWDPLTAIATALAVLFGGLFAYYRFINDRIYRARIGFGFRVGYLEIEQKQFIRIAVVAKNIGNSKVKIKHEAAFVVVTIGSLSQPDDFTRVHWTENDKPEFTDLDRTAVLKIFQSHEWLESSETMRDEVMVRVPNEADSVFRLNLVFGIRRNRLLYRGKDVTIETYRIVQGLDKFTDDQWTASIPIEGEATA